MKAWLIRMVHRQAQLDGKIRWSVQFIVQSVATIIFCLLMIGLVGYYMIVSGSLEDFATNRSKDEMHHIVDAMGTAIEALVPSDVVIGPDLKPEVQDLIKTLIRNAKYDYPNGYFILFQDGTVVSQGIEPENVGVNRLEAQDYRGAFHVRQLRDAARQGGGFVEYLWKKLDDGLPFKKLAYARPLRGGQWWIASGVYLDSIGRGSSLYIDKQGWYLAGFTIGLLALMAGLLFAVFKFGNDIAQPAIEQMRVFSKMTDDECCSVSGEVHNLVEDLTFKLKPTCTKMADTEDATKRQLLAKEALACIDASSQKCQELSRRIFLRLVQHLGTEAGLRNLVEEKTKGLEAPHVDLVIGESVERSDSRREHALYLVAQGLFLNALKFAQASKIRIVLTSQAQHVTLMVEDDGIGFDMKRVHQRAQRRFGIQWMYAQVAVYEGTLEIHSSLGKGTTARIILPWPTQIS